MQAAQNQAYRDAREHLEKAAAALDILHRDVHCAYRNLATAVREIAATLPDVNDAIEEANRAAKR